MGRDLQFQKLTQELSHLAHTLVIKVLDLALDSVGENLGTTLRLGQLIASDLNFCWSKLLLVHVDTNLSTIILIEVEGRAKNVAKSRCKIRLFENPIF